MTRVARETALMPQGMCATDDAVDQRVAGASVVAGLPPCHHASLAEQWLGHNMERRGGEASTCVRAVLAFCDIGTLYVSRACCHATVSAFW